MLLPRCVHRLIHSSFNTYSLGGSDDDGGWISFPRAHPLPLGDGKHLCSLADQPDPGGPSPRRESGRPVGGAATPCVGGKALRGRGTLW